MDIYTVILDNIANGTRPPTPYHSVVAQKTFRQIDFSTSQGRVKFLMDITEFALFVLRLELDPTVHLNACVSTINGVCSYMMLKNQSRL